MANSAELRKSGFWTTVVLYGLALAALVFVLKYFEYRFWIRELRVEVYIGLVALLFTALGIWMGSKLLHQQKDLVTAEQGEPVSTPPQVDEEALRRIGLSGREREVLQLMATGNSNQEIADKLFISLPTVKSHSSNLFMKSEVKRRTEAVHKAKSLGLIP
ncbi:MAG: DNA-binding response regulator [Flavobacteriales bacterium]|nr:DNA-binding response regulator [Flavobacteriales bacterium]